MDKNLVSFKLLVDKDNDGAIKTYEKLGYVHQAHNLLFTSTCSAY